MKQPLRTRQQMLRARALAGKPRRAHSRISSNMSSRMWAVLRSLAVELGFYVATRR